MGPQQDENNPNRNQGARMGKVHEEDIDTKKVTGINTEVQGRLNSFTDGPVQINSTQESQAVGDTSVTKEEVVEAHNWDNESETSTGTGMGMRGRSSGKKGGGSGDGNAGMGKMDTSGSGEEKKEEAPEESEDVSNQILADVGITSNDSTEPNNPDDGAGEETHETENGDQLNDSPPEQEQEGEKTEEEQLADQAADFLSDIDPNIAKEEGAAPGGNEKSTEDADKGVPDDEVEKASSSGMGGNDKGGGPQRSGNRGTQDTPQVDKEKDPREINFEEGRALGLEVGRNVGYGKILTPGKTEDGADIYERMTYQEYLQKAEGKTFAEDATADAKDYYIRREDEKAKNIEQFGSEKSNTDPNNSSPVDPVKPNFFSGYTMGYNIGYTQGQNVQAEEEAAEANAAREAMMAKPEFQLGTEMGKLGGSLSAQGKTEFEITGSNQKKYSTSLDQARNNADKGLDPDGNEVGDGGTYASAFTQAYNIAYQDVVAVQNKVPTHEERLADPNFRKGYEQGNKLGRHRMGGATLKPAELKTLEKVDADHSSEGGSRKAEGDAAYAKERSGFIYGFNGAFYQLQAEQAAREKAYRERRDKDPIYKIGKAAGIIKGILTAVFTEAGVRGALQNPKQMEEAGIDFTVPEDIKKAILQGGIREHESLTDPSGLTGEDKIKAEEKRAEQLHFFKEGYQRFFLEGYKKGQNDQAIYRQNKAMRDPDYKRAMEVVYKTNDKNPHTNEPVVYNLNRGGLVAYAEFKMEHSSNDTNNLQAKVDEYKATLQNESKGFVTGYQASYDTVANMLVDPKNDLYSAIVGQEALAAFAGSTSDEKKYYSVGAIIGREELKGKEAIKKEQSLGGSGAGMPEALYQRIQDLQIKTKAKIATTLMQQSNYQNIPKLEANSLEALDDVLSKQVPPEIYSQTQHFFKFVGNGYSAVIYNSMQKKKSDRGNNKGEMQKDLANLEKIYGNSSSNALIEEKDIGLKIEYCTGAAVSKAIKKQKKKAEELYKAGAGEGFNYAYNRFKETITNGTITNKDQLADTSAMKKHFEGRIDSQRKSLKGDSEFGSDRNMIAGLLFFYAKGVSYNNPLNTSLKIEHGVPKAYLDAMSYMKGYHEIDLSGNSKGGSSGGMGKGRRGRQNNSTPSVDVSTINVSSNTSYEEGKADGLANKSYNAFANAMKQKEEDKNIPEPQDSKTGNQIADTITPFFRHILYLEAGRTVDPSLNLPSTLDIQTDASDMGSIRGLTANETSSVKISSELDRYVEQALTYQKRVLETGYRLMYGFLSWTNLADATKEEIAEKVNTQMKEATAIVKEKIDHYKNEVIENKFDDFLYSFGFYDGFVRIYGNEDIPVEIHHIEVNRAELLKKHPELKSGDANEDYKEGNVLGADLGMKFKTGLIDKEALGAALTKNQGSIRTGDFSNPFALGQTAGSKLGDEDAVSDTPNQHIPNPLENWEKKVGDSKDPSKAKNGASGELDQPKEMSPDYKQAFLKAYWEARDKVVGLVAGLQAVVDGHGDVDDISEFYVVVADEEEIPANQNAISAVTGKEKFIVKNANIFEQNFFVQRERAKLADNPEELLNELKNKQEETDPKEQFKKNQADRIKGIASEYGQLYGYYKAVKETIGEEKLKILKENQAATIANAQQDPEQGTGNQVAAGLEATGRLGAYQKLASKLTTKNHTTIYTTSSEGMQVADAYGAPTGSISEVPVIADLIKQLEGEQVNVEGSVGMGTSKAGGTRKKTNKIAGLGSFSEEQREALLTELHQIYLEEYNLQKANAYGEGVGALIEDFMFSTGTGALGGSGSSGDRDELGNLIGALDDVNIKEEATLNGLSIINVLGRLEQALIDAHNKIGDARGELVSAMVDKESLEDELQFKEDLFGSKEKLREKLRRLDVQKKEQELNKEDQEEYDRVKRHLDSMKDLEQKIKDKSDIVDNEHNKESQAVEEVRNFFNNELKFNVQKQNDPAILSYIEFFDRELDLKSSFGYDTESSKLGGSGWLTVRENAEDVYVDANITIKSGEYEFTAQGFEYIEDRNYITLFSGTAVTPKLEGDNSNNEKGKYIFSSIGLDISGGLHTQMSYQRPKLVAGPPIRSTGSRDKLPEDPSKK